MSLDPSYHFGIEAKQILEEFDLSEFHYIFSVFRDPVDRLVSEYKWICTEGCEKHPDFPYWVEWIFRCYEENHYVNDNHRRPKRKCYVTSNTNDMKQCVPLIE